VNGLAWVGTQDLDRCPPTTGVLAHADRGHVRDANLQKSEPLVLNEVEPSVSSVLLQEGSKSEVLDARAAASQDPSDEAGDGIPD